MSKRNVLFGFGLLVLTAVAAGLAGCGACCGEPKAVAAAPRQEAQVCSVDLVGVRGPDGLTGPAGAQGPIGQTGSSGDTLIGPRGAEGSAGPTGIQGATGSMGPAGAVVAGGSGLIGRTGPAGPQGEAGVTGAQGASAEGYAGPTGPAGPAGRQGETGLTGAQGPTLIGPTGPAGHVGPAGVQGETGIVGLTGSTTLGIAGPTGPVGVVGAQGPTGLTGATGVVGIVPCWVSYRNFRFDMGKADVRVSDANMVADIAAYMKLNPSLELGLDGFMDSHNLDLSNNRVNAVRDALIQAGVPADKIKAGAFGDAKNRQERQVEVLINTAK